MKEVALIIFIKNPELGKVKTRIAKDSGDEMALRIYRKLLDHTRLMSLELDCTKYLYYSYFIDQQDEWHPADFDKLQQIGMDLGERMMDAFVEALSYHKKVVIIGSDCIELTKKHIEEAFKQLDTNDVVIGPTVDGGYYLLGMKQAHTPLFIGIPWSSGNEYNITRQRTLSKGLSLFNLEKLNDIDHLSDWEAYQNKT